MIPSIENLSDQHERESLNAEFGKIIMPEFRPGLVAISLPFASSTSDFLLAHAE